MRNLDVTILTVIHCKNIKGKSEVKDSCPSPSCHQDIATISSDTYIKSLENFKKS